MYLEKEMMVFIAVHYGPKTLKRHVGNCQIYLLVKTDRYIFLGYHAVPIILRSESYHALKVLCNG